MFSKLCVLSFFAPMCTWCNWLYSHNCVVLIKWFLGFNIVRILNGSFQSIDQIHWFIDQIHWYRFIDTLQCNTIQYNTIRYISLTCLHDWQSMEIMQQSVDIFVLAVIKSEAVNSLVEYLRRCQISVKKICHSELPG